jgi:magnesium chelatase family protein
MVLAAGSQGRSFVLPTSSAREAALAGQVRVLTANTLLEVCAHLTGQGVAGRMPAGDESTAVGSDYPDLADVRGQAQAKRALEIAAAGAHSILLAGPPGTGKSMLASRLPGLLPPMTLAAALESAAVLSSAGQFRPEFFRRHPYRAPHHTASSAALVGGGSVPRPGEISLAHQGVLFLDEIPEFDRRVLEALREPLDSGRIHISRAARQAEFPAQFQLVAAMNPCPCGYHGDPRGRCRCTAEQVSRYRSPALRSAARPHRSADRGSRLAAEALQKAADGEASAVVRAARRAGAGAQIERQGKANAHLTTGKSTTFASPKRPLPPC